MRNGRPDFIPRENFRAYLGAGDLNKLFRVGTILPASYIGRCKREGRPIKTHGTAWRPIDIVARARANGLEICPPPTRELSREIEELEQRRCQLLKELNELSEKLAVKHALGGLSEKLTGLALLNEEEIVAAKLSIQQPSGIYFLIRKNAVVYVGQSVNIYARIAAHAVRDFDSFAYIPCPREMLDVLKSLYIHTLKPPWNGDNRIGHGKSAPIRP